MAGLNDIDRIIQALLSGNASPKDVMKKYKLKPIQLAALLSASPSGLEKIASSAQKQYGRYETYNPSVRYDIAATNPALDKYKAYPEKYQGIIRDFAISALRDPVAAKTMFPNRDEKTAKAYGLSLSEYSAIKNQLEKDADNIVQGESARKIKEYAAFQKGRSDIYKKAGIKPVYPEGGTIRAGFKSITGVDPALYDLVKKYTETKGSDPSWILQEGGKAGGYPQMAKEYKKRTKKAEKGYSTGVYDFLKNLLGKSL